MAVSSKEQVDPKSASAYIARGDTYNRKGQYDLAIADCSKAIEVYPEAGGSYLQRGIAYNSKGQYDLAITDYSKAIELYQPMVLDAAAGRVIANVQDLSKQLAVAYYNKGTVLSQLGRNNGAIECFKNFLQYAAPDDKLTEQVKQQIKTLGGPILNLSQ